MCAVLWTHSFAKRNSVILNLEKGMETWKTIENYQDYEVSDTGKIRSLKHGKHRILRDRPDGCGYLQVILCVDGKQFSHKIHKLVAQAFIPNIENKPQIDHIDRIVTNNHKDNLRWATRSENMLNTYRHYRDTYSIRWLEDIKKYKVQINIRNKQNYLGCFGTFEEAKKVRDEFMATTFVKRT